MSEAVTRLRRAIDAGEMIAVYGDYDADGVTATALSDPNIDRPGRPRLPLHPRSL